MELRHHPSNNATFAAPASTDNEEAKVTDLPVTRTMIEGQKFLVSYWEPSMEERKQILQGQPVRLWVMGTQHPIVAIDVDPGITEVKPGQRVIVEH